MSLFLKSHSMSVAALALAMGVLLSRIMGLVRDKIISYYFGATPEADIYFVAFVVPDYLNYLLAGGYFSITLVPLLTSSFMKDPKDGWRFFSAAVCWAFIAILLCTVVAFICARPLAALIAPGFSEAHLDRLAFFLRIILPAQVAFLPGACFTAMLYLRKQFTIPALTPLIYNGCIILVGCLFLWVWPEKGMEGFCWGVLAGAMLGSLLLPIWGVKAQELHFTPILTHPGMKRVLWLALPLILGQSIVVLDEQFIRIFGSLTGDGSVSLLNYARRIMLVPVGVIAQAAGLASYPFLAALAAKGLEGRKEFDSQINSTLTATMLVALPVSLWLMVAGEPVMRLIFQQGSFSAENAAEAGVLLSIMMSAVIFWCIQQVLGRGFYAYQDMATPAITGTVATMVALPLYWFGARYYGVQGVALAGCVGVFLYTLLLLWRWQKKNGSGALQGLLRTLVRGLCYCLPAAALAWGTNLMIAHTMGEASLLSAACRIAGSGLAFALAYFAILLPLAPDLCAPITGIIKRIFRRAHNHTSSV